jgi:hypothetical protein
MRDCQMPTPGVESRGVRHVFDQAGSRESQPDHKSAGRKFKVGGRGNSLKVSICIA